MNDWKIIWNGFCDEVANSVRRNNLEKVFEEDIAREFFRALDWYRLNKGLVEQYPVKFATVIHKADFALFVSGKESPEIIVELKRPKKKKEEKDAKQLIDYMKQTSCSYGILLLGEKLEIYYIDYSKPQHEASLVEIIKYQHDNDAARQFMEVLYRGSYDSAHMLEYCHKRVKINKSVEYWCSVDGRKEILNMIVERSQLPEHLQENLRSTLIVDVKRRDGLGPVVVPVVQSKIDVPVTSTPRVKSPDGKQKIWMIPANPRYFNHRACFDELGAIYWSQYFNYQVGDIVYIYLSRTIKRVVYKCEVLEANLPYSAKIEAEKKFYKNSEDMEKGKRNNRYVLFKKIGESTSDKLNQSCLLNHGMKKAPQGALLLSDASYSELLQYIEDNF